MYYEKMGCPATLKPSVGNSAGVASISKPVTSCPKDGIDQDRVMDKERHMSITPDYLRILTGRRFANSAIALAVDTG